MPRTSTIRELALKLREEPTPRKPVHNDSCLSPAFFEAPEEFKSFLQKSGLAVPTLEESTDVAGETEAKSKASTKRVYNLPANKTFSHKLKAVIYFLFLQSLVIIWPTAILVLLFVYWPLALSLLAISMLMKPPSNAAHHRYHQRLIGYFRRLIFPTFETLGLRIIVENPDDIPKTGVIFSHAPHGVWTLSFLAGILYQPIVLPDRQSPLPLVFSPCFRLPPYRAVLGSLGAVPAELNTLRSALHAGRNIAITPGGLPEMYLADDRRPLILCHKRRTAFVREAIAAGCPIVPVLSPEGHRLFRQPPFLRVRMWMGRRLKVPVTFAWGGWGITSLPRLEGPLQVVFGRTISVDARIGESEADAVVRIHSEYLIEMERLANEYGDGCIIQ